MWQIYLNCTFFRQSTLCAVHKSVIFQEVIGKSNQGHPGFVTIFSNQPSHSLQELVEGFCQLKTVSVCITELLMSSQIAHSVIKGLLTHTPVCENLSQLFDKMCNEFDSLTGNHLCCSFKNKNNAWMPMFHKILMFIACFFEKASNSAATFPFRS